MSILFQDGNLFPHLSVTQNVGLALRSDLRMTADQDAQVAQVLDAGGSGRHGRAAACGSVWGAARARGVGAADVAGAARGAAG
jgi:thiamine transport system ATP-binding protein